MARTKTDKIEFDSEKIINSIKEQAFKEGYMKACNDMMGGIVSLMNIGLLSKEEQLEKIHEAVKLAETQLSE